MTLRRSPKFGRLDVGNSGLKGGHTRNGGGQVVVGGVLVDVQRGDGGADGGGHVGGLGILAQIDGGIIQQDDALADLPEMDDAIDRFLARRWQGKDPDDKEVKRTVDALIRRGHSWKDIQAGLRRYRADLELEENTEDYIP